MVVTYYENNDVSVKQVRRKDYDGVVVAALREIFVAVHFLGRGNPCHQAGQGTCGGNESGRRA